MATTVQNKSLLDDLLALDKGDLTAVKEMTVKAENLSRVMGHDVYVKVHSLSGNTYTSITRKSYDKDGNLDIEKSYDVNALVVCSGLSKSSIDLKNQALQEHFGAASPKDLAKIIFRGTELVHIANIIGYLSGFVDAETAEIDDTDSADIPTEETVKN